MDEARTLALFQGGALGLIPVERDPGAARILSGQLIRDHEFAPRSKAGMRQCGNER